MAGALAAYGLGSMVAAFMLPRLLDRAVSDRTAMLVGAALLVMGLLAGPQVASWPALLALWALLGLGNGLVLTPAGRLLRRSAAAGDRPALFAAQFALSHACWLLAYPLAGRLGAAAGLDVAFLLLAGLAALGGLVAATLWPRTDGPLVEHIHRDLPATDTHLADTDPVPGGGFRHRHALAFDARHPDWMR